MTLKKYLAVLLAVAMAASVVSPAPSFARDRGADVEDDASVEPGDADADDDEDVAADDDDDDEDGGVTIGSKKGLRIQLSPFEGEDGKRRLKGKFKFKGLSIRIGG